MWFVTLVLLPPGTDASVNGPSPEVVFAQAVESLDVGRPEAARQQLVGLSRLESPWAERSEFLLSRMDAAEGNWEKAFSRSLRAAPQLVVIGDYVLLDQARLLRRLGREADAIEALMRLRSGYPDSPLMYDARILEAELRLDLFSAEESMDVLEPLLARGDPHAMMLAAAGHRKRGEFDRAESLCRRIYLERPASPHADRARDMLRELGRFDFSQDEELTRAAHLVEARQTDAAERIYRAWLARSPTDALWEDLGICLFRGRRYVEAAEALERGSGQEAAFLRLRALYRSGLTPEGTLGAIDELLARFPSLDSRLYALRLEIARDLRRMGQTKRAVSLLKDLQRKYPASVETTRWELGWTYFKDNELDGALRALKDLRSSDGSPVRPQYWRARILDAQGKKRPAEQVYRSIAGSRSAGYYGLLASEKVPAGQERLARGRMVSADGGMVPKDAVHFGSRPARDRIQELRVLGLFEEACDELPFLARGIEGEKDVLSLAHLCVQLGDYPRAISLAQSLGRFHETALGFGYPRGFWDLVVQAAERENVDPYLVAAVIREESGFREDVVSTAGAVGLMQLLPTTAVRNHQGAGLPRPRASDLKLADVNIPVGVHYLATLLKRYEGDLFKSVAAYNAGEAAVDRWLRELGENTPSDVFAEEIPYRETRQYVRKVLGSYWMYMQVWGERRSPLIDVAATD